MLLFDDNLIANLREFGAKESFMVVCNPWIISHKTQMVEFISAFCRIDEFEEANSGMFCAF